MKKNLSSSLIGASLVLGSLESGCAAPEKISCDIFGGDTSVHFNIMPTYYKGDKRFSGSLDARPRVQALSEDCVGSVSSAENKLYLSTSESCKDNGDVFGVSLSDLSWNCNQAVNACIAELDEGDFDNTYSDEFKKTPKHRVFDKSTAPKFIVMPCGEQNYFSVFRITEDKVDSLNGSLGECVSSYQVGAPIYEAVYDGGKIYEKEHVEGCKDMFGMASFSYGPLVGVVTHEFMDSLKK